MTKKFKKGDRVKTSTHAVYQDTQDSLNNLQGIVVNTDDYPYNIHVKIDGKRKWGNIGFSEFELTKTNKKREELENKLRDTVIEQIKEDIRMMDETAIDELLTFVSVENLIQYLTENKWKDFEKLWKPKKGK
jgi:hypothetical protein